MATDGINPLQRVLERDTESVPVSSTVDSGMAVEAPPVEAADSAAAEDEAQTQPTREQVEELTKVLNDNADLSKIALQFRVDEDVDRIVVSVFDRNTETLIRQVPPEEVISFVKSLNQMVGLLFDVKA